MAAMVNLPVVFGWPLALLLLPLPLFALLRNRDAKAEAIKAPPLLSQAFAAAGSGEGRSSRWLAALLWLAWVLLVLAIAQPALVAGATIRPASGRSIVLVMDLSSSMERKDFQVDGKSVDRLTALKTVAREFIEKREGDRLGLVLFGDEAFSAAPISYDLASISNALEESAIGMAGRATAIGDALGLAIVKLRDDPAAAKTVLLLSDGTNNAGEAEPEDAARLAKDFGIRIQTIGMGSEKTSDAGDPIDPSADLDEATLKQIAEITGGAFFRARTTDELSQVYQEIDRIESSEADAPPVAPRIDIRNWLLAAMAALLGLFIAASRRRLA